MTNLVDSKGAFTVYGSLSGLSYTNHCPSPEGSVFDICSPS